MPPAWLVHTFCWDSGDWASAVKTRIDIQFTERDGGTQIDMRHTGFTTIAARDGHSGSWSSQYDTLVGYLDERGTAATLTLLGVARRSFTRTARMGLIEKGVDPARTYQAMP